MEIGPRLKVSSAHLTGVSDLGPYCLQYRTPRCISRSELTTIVGSGGIAVKYPGSSKIQNVIWYHEFAFATVLIPVLMSAF